MIKCVKKSCLNCHELHFVNQFDNVIEEIINFNDNFNGFDVALDSLKLEKGDKELGIIGSWIAIHITNSQDVFLDF